MAVKIDEDLNPENAKEKGYHWVKDTIFSPKAKLFYEEIIELTKKGYCLGKPSFKNESEVVVGLYKPL